MIRLIMPTRFVVGAVFSLLLSTQLHAQSVNGVFKVVKGDVQVVQASDGQTVAAKIGAKVFPKDTIVAGKDSRAKIVMVDNNEINISPDTRLEIKAYEFKQGEDKKNVLLDVMYGKVRAKVSQHYEGDNKFQVKTPSAVAGVRGTDFITSFDPGTKASSVITFTGKVAFGQPGANGAINNAVFVTAGQMSASSGNKAPSAPVTVPKADMAKMDQQSDASTGSRQPADAGSKGTGNGKGSNSSNGNGNSASNGAGPTSGSADRAPASAGTPAPAQAGGSGMMLSSDMPSSQAPQPVLNTTNSPNQQIILQPGGPLPPPSPNDFIKNVISGGNKKVGISVTTGK